ncbi:VOC family protein [Candidatus Microgenomates bacterium]|nr:MAG: VOC family protein [Candidatus Microgenomates bacterium]
MFKNISLILIWSENYKKLAQWYQDKLDAELVEELTHPQDTGVMLHIGKGRLWIGQHSEVHGKNQDPCRHMFNIDVDSVEEAYNYLKDKGVEFVATPFKAPTFDKYFATFYDLDRNMVQLIGGK